MNLDDLSLDELRSRAAQLAEQLRLANEREGVHPAGDTYSPIPDRDFIRQWLTLPRPVQPALPGIALDPARQLALLEDLRPYGADFPFPATDDGVHRYYYENSWFGGGDAVALYAMLRHLRPTCVVEVGSGFSSALMMDVNDRCFGGNMKLVFIEPFTQRLTTLMRPGDANTIVIERPVQFCESDVFRWLRPNDILFIDSSHVFKYGSDVSHLLWNVLPLLQPGVIVHVHDIYYPFEYPDNWLAQGRFYNECYIMRAFLTDNPTYRIELFNDYLGRFHQDATRAVNPLWAGGGSLWLRKHHPPRAA